jgi:hypothetical protein
VKEPTPSDRLAAELPPQACRRILARLEEMRGRGEAGPVATIKLDDTGHVYVEVRELYILRS